MSTDSQHTKPSEESTGARAARPQDDFVSRETPARGNQASDVKERRLHLQAFDYWHGLHGDTPVPLFAQLTNEGLSPFKRNCLLLEYTGEQFLVRFCGPALGALLGEKVQAGGDFTQTGQTPFASALLARLKADGGREEAAEFEFADSEIECRGILLPFSSRGDAAEFTMVVINHRHLPKQAVVDAPARGDDTSGDMAFDTLAAACKQAGDAVVHPGASTREGLYLALAEAYRFHIDASKDPAAYRQYLRGQKLRQQQRAPFTPALKLTFGPTYEKTRLTEYAAALSYAARHGVDPEHLPDFLKGEPGGIKGCVARERAFRRGEASPEEASEKARSAARTLAMISLQDLAFNSEYELVLVRDDGNGNKAVLSVVDASSHLIDRAINEALKKNSDE